MTYGSDLHIHEHDRIARQGLDHMLAVHVHTSCVNVHEAGSAKLTGQLPACPKPNLSILAGTWSH